MSIFGRLNERQIKVCEGRDGGGENGNESIPIDINYIPTDNNYCSQRKTKLRPAEDGCILIVLKMVLNMQIIHHS